MIFLHCSLLRYWINTTRGYLDLLNSSLFPWVDITLGADTSRSAQAMAAINALRARYPGHDPFAGLDGLGGKMLLLRHAAVIVLKC